LTPPAGAGAGSGATWKEGAITMGTTYDVVGPRVLVRRPDVFAGRGPAERSSGAFYALVRRRYRPGAIWNWRLKARLKAACDS
jgi:hypothetical protein